VTDDERQELKDELLMAELDKTRLDLVRLRQEMKWEPYKAVAAVIGAGVACMGIILAVAHVIH
jgi:hypothetical protein